MSPTALKGRSGLLRLSLLSLAIGAGPACAQDSGVGVDLQFGNALNPAGKFDHGCDPDGFTWLAGESKRTPTGFLYACTPATPDYAEDGEWLTRARHCSWATCRFPATRTRCNGGASRAAM